jgi:hypothetical protein
MPGVDIADLTKMFCQGIYPWETFNAAAEIF